ncbi:MAG TPA: hypothetical protein VIR98_00050 [Candidatus Paceibacterota bacterium]|jgi:hypothetical protein
MAIKSPARAELRSQKFLTLFETFSFIVNRLEMYTDDEETKTDCCGAGQVETVASFCEPNGCVRTCACYRVCADADISCAFRAAVLEAGIQSHHGQDTSREENNYEAHEAECLEQIFVNDRHRHEISEEKRQAEANKAPKSQRSCAESSCGF